MSLKAILITSGVAVVLSAGMPHNSAAQIAQQPTVVSPTTGQPPTGAASGTTDKQGQTNKPAGTSGSTERPKGKLRIGSPKAPKPAAAQRAARHHGRAKRHVKQ
jgi:hypothetical protein